MRYLVELLFKNWVVDTQNLMLQLRDDRVRQVRRVNIEGTMRELKAANQNLQKMTDVIKNE